MKPLNVDDVYDIIGHFKFSQIIYLITLSLPSVFLAQHLILNIFIGLETPFVCYNRSDVSNTSYCYDRCYGNAVSNCRLKYNASHHTIIEEWNLVCDHKYKVALVQSIWMGGVMAGALLLGSVADRIGRLRTLMLSLAGTIAFEGFTAFSSSYTLFVMLRFFGGMMCAVVILATFVLMQELIGGRQRSLATVLSSLFFPVGISVLSALAACIEDWRTLTLITSLYGISCFIMPCILPESPRWLAATGRAREAKRVLEVMAEKNGTSHLLPSQWEVVVESQETEEQKSQGVSALFCQPRLLKITFILIYSWFVNSAVYYALTMAAVTVNPGGNVYWDTTLNGFVEVPSNLSLLFIIERYGRRFSICFFMVGGGIFCMLVPFVPPTYSTAFVLIGKMSISASFTAIYLHSVEIFPTVIRNTAMGVMSVAARVGGIVSPFVLMLADLHPNLHFMVLGLATFLAGVLNMGLPETLGCPLPETVADLVTLGKQSSRSSTKATFDVSREKGYQKLRQSDDEEEN